MLSWVEDRCTRQVGSEAAAMEFTFSRVERRVRRSPDQPPGLPRRVRQKRNEWEISSCRMVGSASLTAQPQSRSPIASPRRKRFEPELDL